MFETLFTFENGLTTAVAFFELVNALIIFYVGAIRIERSSRRFTWRCKAPGPVTLRRVKIRAILRF